jgi:ubiquinone/menaquinone biosynthesis C-methylase UbiE
MSSRTQKVKEFFNETDKYLKNNLVISLRADLIKSNLPEILNKRILDIGCGNGDLTLPYLKDNKISFLDFSENMLRLVKTKIPPEYLQNAEFLNIELDKYIEIKKYDYLFMIGVLAHLDSLDTVFLKLAELLEDRGTLIIQFTSDKNLVSFLIRFIYQIKKLFGKRLEYKTNSISLKKIKKELARNKLKYYKKVAYWPALPGFSFLPSGVRKFIYFNLLNNRLLQNLGGEKLLFISFVKDK